MLLQILYKARQSTAWAHSAEETPTWKSILSMSRFSICLLFVVAVAYVMADEDCPDGCPCGQSCNGGACEDGCKIFDNFVAMGATQAVYGRDCLCSDEVDDKGRVVKCSEGEFAGAPAGDAWTQNANCP